MVARCYRLAVQLGAGSAACGRSFAEVRAEAPIRPARARARSIRA